MTPKEKNICQKALEGIIQKAFGGPSGDPDPTHIRVAVMAYKTMKKLKLDVSEIETEGFVDNGYDYLKDVDYDGRYLPEKLTKGEKKAILSEWEKKK